MAQDVSSTTIMTRLEAHGCKQSGGLPNNGRIVGVYTKACQFTTRDLGALSNTVATYSYGTHLIQAPGQAEQLMKSVRIVWG